MNFERKIDHLMEFGKGKSTVKPALNDHRFKRPPAFSDRFFMHGESAIQTALC